jgi:hypothetical protein
MTAARFNPTLVARTALLDGSVSGLRTIDSLGSILRVTAAPFSELDRAKARISSPYIAYVVDTDPAYAGYGRLNREIGDRVKELLRAATQVYIIDGNDTRFAKYEAAYIEARLIETGAKLGVLANRARPFGRDGLAISPDHEQLVVHARILLSVAGFGRFDEAQPRRSDLPGPLTGISNLHDVHVLDPNTMTAPAGALRMRLNWRGLQAEGYIVGSRFRLLPHADYCFETKTGLSDDNRDRRRAIEGMDILEPVPGVPGRARLLVGLDCKSPAVAGKIISGEHIGNKVWQPQPDLEMAPPSR